VAAREFSINPRIVEHVETCYRRIGSAIPAPETVPILQTLHQNESRSMRGQPPVLWRHAVGFQVEDGCGNRWLDWSSGVLVANAGHSNPRVIRALKQYLEAGAPIMTYCFPGESRAKLTAKLIEISPPEMDRVFLLTTGSEAVEVSIKLARTYSIRRDPGKRTIVSFEGGFHGRTYAAQLAGGALGGADWIDPNPYFVQVPFPGSIDVPDKRFDLFTERLDGLHIQPGQVAGVIAETFQGREARLMPVEYVRALRDWCDRHEAALILDEVQACFGRSGRMFAFEHYGIVPDMVCCGKGITSSLPLSAVIGSSRYLDLYGPGEMTSTHTGSPLPVISALANLEALIEEQLVENAASEGEYLLDELEKIAAPYHDRIDVGGVGLVAGMLFFNNRREMQPDPDTAFRFCQSAIQRGNLFFAPVGKGYATIKFCPPLCITREAIEDGLYGPAGLRETLDEIMADVPAGSRS
jgi:4-aminobutyrate aminotransferase/(S)-3-amino-2-methylpropionate transaminase